jgi:hypothetical protein
MCFMFESVTVTLLADVTAAGGISALHELRFKSLGVFNLA